MFSPLKNLPNSELPRILVPQGWVTTTSPAVEWESALRPTPNNPIQAEIQVTQAADFQATAIWYSGTLTVHSGRVKPGVISLPTREPAWIWLRERPVGATAWSRWSPLGTPVYADPLEDGPEQIWLYDLKPTRTLSPRRAFEEAHFVAALQGIVNRFLPRLFVTFQDIDTWWLQELRLPERWLAHTEVVPVGSLEELVGIFHSSVEGLVVWDPEVNATSNVASTIAGVENLLPVTEDTAEDSLWRRFAVGGPRLPVNRDLRGVFTGHGIISETEMPSTGSRKCDAYVWARHTYLDSGRCNPHYLGYYLDGYWIRNPAPGKDFSNHTLTNHDYFISKNGFFWDLNVWEDEAPVDDPGQEPGLDRRTLIDILTSARRQTMGQAMIRIGGFNPWAFKYTDSPGAGGNYNGVWTEWETVRIASEFDAVVDADALHLSGLANASFYQHFPLPDYLVQGPAPTLETLQRRGFVDALERVAPKTFVLHYVGDYDSAAWALSQIPPRWESAGRGKTLLSWAIDPNLAERAAPLFEYLYRTRSSLDSFQAGDSGAGYVNPTGLLPPRATSGFPPGGELWQRHCAGWFRRMNLTVTGFVINARSGQMTLEAEHLFASFSPDGIVLRDPSRKRLRLEGHLPCIPMSNEGLSPDPGEAAKKILELAGEQGAEEPTFVTCRSVLQYPDFYETVQERLNEARPDGSIMVVDPRTFFYLARIHLGGENRQRATFLFDTLPRRISVSSSVRFHLAIRNDGWDTWSAKGKERVALGVEFTRDVMRTKPKCMPLIRDVPPGDAVVVVVEMPAPEEPGWRYLRAELVRGRRDWFGEAGCLPLLIPLRIG